PRKPPDRPPSRPAETCRSRPPAASATAPAPASLARRGRRPRRARAPRPARRARPRRPGRPPSTHPHSGALELHAGGGRRVLAERHLVRQPASELVQLTPERGRVAQAAELGAGVGGPLGGR